MAVGRWTVVGRRKCGNATLGRFGGPAVVANAVEGSRCV